MSGKATASAAANIAFVKYWGARDLDRVIPVNASISMTLDRCRSTTTVTFEEGPATTASVQVAGRPADAAFSRPVEAQLKRIAERAGVQGAFEIVTENSFPTASGMASSASGFAALTVAGCAAVGLELPPGPLSALAKDSGSGSAARSLHGGYVEWGGDEATQLAGEGHWELHDVIAVVESGAKAVSSRQGHRLAATSPHFAERTRRIPERLQKVRRAISEGDLELLGPVLEEDAIELHLIAMSSRPPVFYWQPATMAVLGAVRGMRDDGVEAWATMDAGANVHVICSPASQPEVVRALGELPAVESVLTDRVGGPPRVEP